MAVVKVATERWCIAAIVVRVPQSSTIHQRRSRTTIEAF